MIDEAIEILREANGLAKEQPKPKLTERELGRREGYGAAITILKAVQRDRGKDAADALDSADGWRLAAGVWKKLDELKK